MQLVPHIVFRLPFVLPPRCGGRVAFFSSGHFKRAADFLPSPNPHAPRFGDAGVSEADLAVLQQVMVLDRAARL